MAATDLCHLQGAFANESSVEVTMLVTEGNGNNETGENSNHEPMEIGNDLMPLINLTDAVLETNVAAPAEASAPPPMDTIQVDNEKIKNLEEQVKNLQSASGELEQVKREMADLRTLIPKVRSRRVLDPNQEVNVMLGGNSNGKTINKFVSGKISL